MVTVIKRVPTRIAQSPQGSSLAAPFVRTRAKSGLNRVSRVKSCRSCTWRYHLAVYFKECPNCGEDIRFIGGGDE
jgi:Zn finger protein HypA/HybF involved in hydrogenase expression